MRAAFKDTIAIPYYPEPRSIEEHEKGFICPKCGYKGQIMNANYCPGCGLKIALLFVSRGDWDNLIDDLQNLPGELQEKNIYKPRKKLKALEGISGIALNELRETQKNIEQNKKVIPGQMTIKG